MDEKRHKAVIHEEICTYEVCKLAKEKGFPQRGIDSNKYWFENFNGIIEEVKDNVFLYEIYPESRLVRKATQSLLQRWLREEKSIHIEISVSVNDKHCFYWTLYSKGCDCWEEVGVCDIEYDTYELALEDALKYALGNLI